MILVDKLVVVHIVFGKNLLVKIGGRYYNSFIGAFCILGV